MVTTHAIACAKCRTRPSSHYGSEPLCCECYVAEGNPPADWHEGCMRAVRPSSFPYLQVAREHGVDYGEVLRLADFIDSDENDKNWPGMPAAFSAEWQVATLRAHSRERVRRLDAAVEQDRRKA